MMMASDRQLTGFARGMRHMPTDAERLLWRALRGRRFLTWKVRRQVPLGPYIADFLCFEARLVIEVDGGQHAECDADLVRDRWFEQNGFRILRLWNHEVLNTTEAALDAVFAALSVVDVEGGAVRKRRAPSSAPAGHLLPRGEKGGRGASPRDVAQAQTGAILQSPVRTTSSDVQEGRSADPHGSSLLPSREKVAAQRPDEGARAAQPGYVAQRPDEGARAAQPGYVAQRPGEGARAAQTREERP